jgi:hypothetical protein
MYNGSVSNGSMYLTALCIQRLCLAARVVAPPSARCRSNGSGAEQLYSIYGGGGDDEDGRDTLSALTLSGDITAGEMENPMWSMRQVGR